MAFGKVFGSEILTSAELNNIVSRVVAVESKADTALAGVGSSAALPGTVAFDSFGASDNARVAGMNTFHKNHGGNILPAVAMPARRISHSTPIELYSGMKMIAYGSPVTQEFSRGCIMAWTGGSGTSQLIFSPTGQTNQGYPSDGSPRNGYMEGIQFEGGSSTNWMPKNDPNTGTPTGKVLWYFIFNGCAWKNFGSVWWGWGNGSQIIGQTHFQGNTMPCLNLAGSEMQIFDNHGLSFMDKDVDSPQPHIISRMDESNIGSVMMTTRKTSWGITIAGGTATNINNLLFDTQESDPSYGAALRITGGSNHAILGCRFQGYMQNPGSGSGGEANNRGFIHVTGGSEIIVDGCSFIPEGTTAPASTPLVYASGGTGIRIGLNRHRGFTAVARQLTGGRIASIDPSITVNTG